METNQDNSTTNTENNNNKTRIIKTVVIVVLILLPLVYLFFKTKVTPDVPKDQSAANQSATLDVAGLENAVKTNPTFDNLINLSMAYINNKTPGKSIDYLKKAIELNPKSAVAYNNLGVAYIMTQQYQNGIDACTNAITIDGTFQLAKNNLNWGMDEKNKVIAAIEAEEKTPTNKRDVPFYIDYGLNYLKVGNYDKSIEMWSKIATIEPKNTTALNNIGTAFMFKKQYDDAIAMFKRAIEFEPNNQLAKNNLAWAEDEKNKAASIKK